MRLLKCFAYGVALGVALAPPAGAVEPDAPLTLISRGEAVGFEVQKRLAEPFRGSAEADKDDLGALVEFYADHGPVWVDDDGLTERGRAVLAELKRAGDYGLNAGDYDLPNGELAKGSAIPAVGLAQAEIKVSRAVLAYARHARGGRIDPASISGYFDPTLTFEDPHEVITTIAAASDPAAYLRSLHPQHPQFEALRQQLLALLGPSDGGMRVTIPAGPVLKPGDKDPRVALLRQRLGVEAAPGAEAELYDETVEAAVREFQGQRGLHVDGVVGPASLQALNGRPADRTKTILVNMERWRWLPRELGDFHVRVNIPEFVVRVVEKGKPIHTERVVVGKVTNQTPVFSKEMEYLDFNPYWNVPNSIKVEDIQPALVRETRQWQGFSPFWGAGWGNNANRPRPRFIERNNLRIQYNGRDVDPYSIDWRTVDIRRFHIFQPPGPPNVMGVVKFMMPNKHDVYMHDTTSKSLFERTVRAYSHGCVRIRDPLKLAEILLSRDQGWSMANIQRAVDGGNLQTVRLKTPVPVHMTYFTAWVDDKGVLRRAGDIYGHDSRLQSALKL